MLAFYTTSTTSMSPLYEPGNLVAVSNLKIPKRGDIISYRTDSVYAGGHSGEIFLAQLIAQEGDTLEIRRSLAYVNGRLVDDSVQLKFSWARPDISPDDYRTLKNYPETFATKDNLIVSILTEQEGKRLHLYKLIANKGAADPMVWNGTEKNWNRDWFGPLVIPKGTVFVLGMSRHNALDSRYRGPIRTDKITGTVLR